MKKFLSTTFLFVLIDRIIKIIVQVFLTGKKIFIIDNFFYLVNVENDGAAFSMLEGKQWLLIMIGVIASIVIIYYVKKNDIKGIGFSLLLGGVIGNLIDRVVYRYVIDYIGFILFNRYMPIFNFADMAIVIGAFIIIFWGDKNEVEN